MFTRSKPSVRLDVLQLSVRMLLHLLVTAVFAASSLPAADYYVSTQGNDANSGQTPAQAWQSITRVNNARFRAGDRVLFQAGQAFSGNLQLTATNIPQSGRPVSITTNGDTPATIDAGTGHAINVYNAANLEISNLRVTTNQFTLGKSGVRFFTDAPASRKFDYIRITNIDASGFGQYGIEIGSSNGNSGFRDVVIQGSNMHDNGDGGLYLWGAFPRPTGKYSHENVTVRSCTAVNNAGLPGTPYNSGNGIVLSSVDTGLIERSVAHDNGWRNTANGGPVGIWAWESNRITIQYNESYLNHTASVTDGGGFDLDGGTTNSVLQYNYSHDNDGAGFLIAEFDGANPLTGNTIRFNISQNDGRRNGYAGIQVWNGGAGISDLEVYNNTIYVNPAAANAPKGLHVMTPTNGIHVRNNLFITAPGLTAVQVDGTQQNMLFQGNNSWSAGAAPAISWNGQAFSSLAAWRTATGQERLNGADTGSTFDPLLAAAGQGPTINNPPQLSQLPAYQLQSGSPVMWKGLDLNRLFRLSLGDSDYFGTPLKGTTLSVGAHTPR